MRSVKKTALAGGLCALAALGAASNANAYTITAPANLILDNYGTNTLSGHNTSITSVQTSGGGTATFSSLGGGGVYSGSTGTATTPFASGSTQDYLAAQPGGSVTINYATAQTSFALLWGTVDDYNSLTFDFESSNGDTVITGSDVKAVDSNITLGTSDVDVLISGLTSFETVVVSSTSSAFEFDTARVPEPASVALLGVGMIGTAVMARRRRSSTSTSAAC